MHKLLERQIRKASAAGSLDLDLLIDLVDRSYQDTDRNLHMNDRTMRLLQSELEAFHARVRNEVEARFTLVMENVGEAVLIIDECGTVETFNLAAERIFGYAASEVVGRNVAMLMPDDLAARHDSCLQLYLATGARRIIGIGREVEARRKDGTLVPVELNVGEVWSGGRRHFIGIIHDVSARRQVEQELRESESRFRDLAGSASDWFWETDERHCLTFVSERIGSVLGVKPSALIGLSHFDIGLDEMPEQARRHRDDLEQRAPFRDLTFPVGPEGGKDRKIIRLSGIPVHDAGGRFIGYRGVGADITREAKAEGLARAAQQRLIDAMDNIGDGIALYDAEDRLVSCNPEYRALFNSVGDSLTPGTSFDDILRRAVLANTFDLEGQPPELWLEARRRRHRDADGAPFIVHMADGRWVQHRDARTHDGGVIAVRTDITAIKQREYEVEQLRRRYELILDSAGEGILGLNGHGQITFANPTACRELGCPPESLIGRHFYTLLAADSDADIRDENLVLDAYRKGLPGGTRTETFLRPDGLALPVDYQVAPIIEYGSVVGAVLVFRDATLRLQYERALANNQRELEELVERRTSALRASQQRLKGITDNLVEGVLVVSATGQVIFSNPSAVRLLGLDPGQDGELYLDQLFRLRSGGETLGFADSPWRQVAQNGDTLQDDDSGFVTERNCGELYVAWGCSPLWFEDGSRAAIISFRDISALKRAQSEALQTSRMASVGQLAAGIAHEINTPTQYIGDNLRFIENSFANLAAAIDAARTLSQAASLNPAMIGAAACFEDRIATLDLPYLMNEIPLAVRQSLDGVDQVGRIVLSMKEFSHPGTASKAMADINHAMETAAMVSRNSWKHVATLDFDLDETLPPIMCHIGELNQVFLNLIINSVHAIEEAQKGGLGHIRISSKRSADHVELVFADDGNGVPLAIRNAIFDPFFTTKEVGRGTGQGLAICRDVVVAKHGGQLSVGGEVGKGAVFTIRLPLQDAAAGDV